MDHPLQALADPIRREILRRVRDQPLPAGSIAALFSVSRPAVSRHLRVLRKAGFVIAELSGRERVYRLDLAPLANIEAYLAELRLPQDAARHAWERRFMTLETEVYRVRARGKAARTKPASDEEEDRMTAPIPSGRLVGNDLHLVRTFRASIEDVWKSFTDPESTARWFGPWRWVDNAGPGMRSPTR